MQHGAGRARTFQPPWESCSPVPPVSSNLVPFLSIFWPTVPAMFIWLSVAPEEGSVTFEWPPGEGLVPDAAGRAPGGAVRSTTTSKWETSVAIAGYGRQNRREHDSDSCHGKGDLHKRMAAFVLDDDSTHVTLVDKFLHLIGEVSRAHFDLLEDSAELVHVGSVARRTQACRSFWHDGQVEGQPAVMRRRAA